MKKRSKISKKNQHSADPLTITNLPRPDIYKLADYKESIRQQLQFLRKNKPSINLQKLASSIGIQYTFLSKVLNSQTHHLSEDHLYKAATFLELTADEIDFLMLLRAKLNSTDNNRKAYLEKQIKSLQQQRFTSADNQGKNLIQSEFDIKYLFDPFTMVVHIALFIDDFRKNPKKLSPLLGLTLNKLEDYLIVLEKLDYIKTKNSPFEIIEVFKKYPHFGPEHPLTRIHQLSIKSFLLNRLPHTPESDKESLFVTFTMDNQGFQQIKQMFRKFLGDAQKVTFDCRHQHLYQMNFDLLKIL